MELASEICQHDHNDSKTVTHGDHTCHVVDNELRYRDVESGKCVSHGQLQTELDAYDITVRKYHLSKFAQSEETSYENYIIMLCMTISYAFIELIFGLMIGSITLQSDAFHMLADSIALTIGLIAKYMGSHHIASNKATFGYKRAEIVGAAMNSIFLLASCLFITINAVERLFDYKDTEIRENFWLLFGVASGGLLINIIGIFMFHSHGGHDHSHEDHKHEDHNHEDKTQSEATKKAKNLNDHGVFLHIMGDFLGSIVVIAMSIVVKLVDDDRVLLVDPICSLIVVALISTTTVKLLKKSVKILMQIVPDNYDVADIISNVEKLDGVVKVHEFYLWSLDTDVIMCSAHVIVKNINGDITDKIKLSLHNDQIHSSTIQLEVNDTTNNNGECHDIVCGEHC